METSGSDLHTKDPQHEKRNRNFQGYGRFSTDSKGRFYFRTVKPVPYPGRTPHIHAAVSQNGKRMLTTQCHIKAEHERNAKDGIYLGIAEEDRELITLDFVPIKGSKIEELAAHWDIVIGSTPEG